MVSRPSSYGLVLVLVATSIVVQMSSAGSPGSRLVTILLQAATLVMAVRAAKPLRRWVRAASVVAVAIAAGSVIVLIVAGEFPEGPAAVVSGLLVAVAPAALAAGLLRDIRDQHAVTMHTLAGVLAIYLLAGMFFAFLYSVVGAIDGSALFTETGGGTPAERLYFSFVTLCTVGYGDLTPAGGVARAFTVAEMLVGQIYLVTVVSLIVSNLGRHRAT